MVRLVLILVIISSLNARISSSSPECTRTFQIIRHNGNEVEMCISNYGKFGQDETGNNQGCWWPLGTIHAYIYGAGICFGTIDSLTGDTLVTAGYRPYGGESEFAPGLAGWSVNHPAAIIYIYPENWPAPPDTLPMAPQNIISHEDSWCCFNDCDSAYHTPGDTRPIGLEIYQTVYAWDSSSWGDMLYFTFDMKNVSGHTLRDCYLGMWSDCDIGHEISGGTNDRCSGIVSREYLIDGDTVVVEDVAYQWQETEEPGPPPWWPGVIAFDLLQTPFDLVEGMDKDGDGILDQYERDSAYYVNNLPASQWDADNDGVPDWRDPSQWPQFGMTALKRFSLLFEPNTDAERYAVLAGYNFLTGSYEPYDTIPPEPDNQRFLMASGPFDLAPDSVVTLVFAVMFADWHGIYIRPDTSAAMIDKYAQDWYDMYWYMYTGIEENYGLRIANFELKISPNPIFHNGTVAFSLPMAGHVSLKLYNIAGQVVHCILDEHRSAGKHSFVLDCISLPQGSYFLVLEASSFMKSRSFIVVH